MPVNNKRAVTVGLALAFPLLVIMQVVVSRTTGHTTTFAITEYADGSVVVSKTVPIEPRDTVTGRGMVRLRFDEQRRGWPVAGTIRHHPATIQTSLIVGGGSIGGPVTSAQRLAIADAVRQTGDSITLQAVEGSTPIIEWRWWGWAASLVWCWVLAGVGFQCIAYIRETRDKLRAWEGQCPSCGYDLSGSPKANQCSECGTVLPERAKYWAVRKGRARP